MNLLCFPSAVPSFLVIPFPPSGPYGFGSPTSTVLWGNATPAAHFAALDFLRAAIPREVRTFAPYLREPEGRAWSCFPGAPPGFCRGRSRFSHVLRESLCALAMFFDPGRIRGLGPMARRTRPPHSSQDEGSLHCGFRGSVARLRHSLSTPRRPQSLKVHARLASGCRPALPDRIDYLQDSSERFQLCFLT
jgi:hypothetical protein